jgi:hypothetical protein
MENEPNNSIDEAEGGDVSGVTVQDSAAHSPIEALEHLWWSVRAIEGGEGLSISDLVLKMAEEIAKISPDPDEVREVIRYLQEYGHLPLP